MQKRLECFFPLQRFCSPFGTVVVVCVCETLSNIQLLLLLLLFTIFLAVFFFFNPPPQDKAEKSLLSLCLFAIAPLCLFRRCSGLLVFFFRVYTRTRRKKKGKSMTN